MINNLSQPQKNLQAEEAGSVTFNCFSPPIMLATFTVEMLLAAYTVWRYKMSVTTRLITICLLTLAIFQLSEYYDCTGLGVSAEAWSRVGYAAISALPPLGLHLLHRLAGKPGRKLVIGSYLTMGAFVAFFLLGKRVFAGYQCTGNYVIFQLNPHPTIAYSLYYYGFLLTAITLGVIWANQFLAGGKKSLTKLQTTRALIIGYLVFLVPTALANSVRPATRRGIPSIMCGFAVLFALILTLYVLPKVASLRHERQQLDTSAK